MKTALIAVTEFHRQIGAPVSTAPKLLDGDPAKASDAADSLKKLMNDPIFVDSNCDEFLQRLHFAIEELYEWAKAHADSDLVEAADAWADRCYLLFGDAIACGFPAEAIFNEIHRSNMTKSASNDSHGKGLKSSHFKRPLLDPILKNSLAN